MFSKVREAIATRYAKAAAFCTLLVLGAPASALAQSSSAQYSLDPATGSIVDQVKDVLTDVLPIAGGLLALIIGWKLLRRMVKA